MLPTNYYHMFKQDFALNNLQGLICRKTQPNLSYYEGWMESSLANQDTLTECDQMWFIFQHNPLQNFSISVTVLGSGYQNNVINSRYDIVI